MVGGWGGGVRLASADDRMRVSSRLIPELKFGNFIGPKEKEGMSLVLIIMIAKALVWTANFPSQ